MLIRYTVLLLLLYKGLAWLVFPPTLGQISVSLVVPKDETAGLYLEDISYNAVSFRHFKCRGRMLTPHKVHGKTGGTVEYLLSLWDVDSGLLLVLHKHVEPLLLLPCTHYGFLLANLIKDAFLHLLHCLSPTQLMCHLLHEASQISLPCKAGLYDPPLYPIGSCSSLYHYALFH